VAESNVIESPPKIVLVTDAWDPQVNGVVRTLKTTIRELQRLGQEVCVVQPRAFRRLPCPFTHDIDLAWNITPAFVADSIRPPCRVHICTEGPLGWAFRLFCAYRGIPYTTAYHTNFPEYVHEHTGLPVSWGVGVIRWFHWHSQAVMVATASLARKLQSRRFRPQPKLWSRGVDHGLFRPRPKTMPRSRPLALYVGRVAKEKNVEAFLQARNPVEKYVVGDGPEMVALSRKYPEVQFLGALHGHRLADMYSNADVFVFPSLTDTFGLVVIEALSSGVPVASYPVDGPADILGNHAGVGCCHDDLEKAIDGALHSGDPTRCAELGRQYSWESCTRQFLANLVWHV
jgi:glycosyltransferase involved in cell wall biosynthesis